MKAVVLCGGFAKRMWPLTKDSPKSLLPIKGKPILEYILKKFESLEGLDQVFISTNNAFEQAFASFLQTYQSSKLLKLVVEPTNSEEDKLGAVRGLEHVIDTEDITEPIIVINGDNLFEDGLFGMLSMYKKFKTSVVGLYDVKSLELAKKLGVAETDEKDLIVGFEEKPQEPRSTLASTGIYIFTVPALNQIPKYLKDNPGDRPGDFVKWLAGQEKVHGFVFPGKWFDIGSVEEYQRAEQEWND